MNWKRLAAIGLIAVILAPGTFVRSTIVQPANDEVVFDPLRDITTPEDWPAGLTLEGGWNLRTDNPGFFGFSALVHGPDGGFFAFNDGGGVAGFPRPTTAKGALALSPVPFDPRLPDLPDIEAAWQDPGSQNLWLSYEHHNAIRRIGADGSSQIVMPELMQGWGGNSGGEAMMRLEDGRFVVLAERHGKALLFDGDPVEGAQAQSFTVRQFGEFLPTDMAQLPDGRVLVLLRALRWQLPPFVSMLAVGDPRDIAPGERWDLTKVVQFDQFGLRENYEGLAIEPAGENTVTLWLISDDNRSTLQRTLMLKLRWDYSAHMETAREVETSGPLTSD